MKLLIYPSLVLLLACSSNETDPSTKAAVPEQQQKQARAQEKELEATFIKAQKELSNSLGSGYDTVEYYSSRFDSIITNTLASHPETLSFPFKQLQDSTGCPIATSSDHKLRVYSWDTWTGGTMHYFNSIVQCQGAKAVFTVKPKLEEGDPGGWCSRIYTVNLKNKVFYLAVYDAIYSTKDKGVFVCAYTIEDNRLVDTVKLFKTKKERLNRIDVGYDMFVKPSRPGDFDDLIRYDAQQKKLFIAVVQEGGQVTAKNIVYLQKEDGFEYVGVE